MARETLTREISEAAITDLMQAVGLLVRRVRAEGGAQDISWTQAIVLKHLADAPATIADLARAEGMKPQSMGATVAALEEMGLVERKPHPTDGRQVNICMTAKGAALRKKTGEAKRLWLARAISQLSAEDQARLFAASKIMKRLVEF